MLATSYILSCSLYIFFGKASMQTFCPTYYYFFFFGIASLLSFFFSCSQRGRLFMAGHRILITAASPVEERRL